MTLDTLIAIFALFAAAYAIIPRSMRLTLGLRVGVFHWVVIAMCLVLVHILLFYSILQEKCIFPSPLCVIPKWPFEDKIFSPGQAAYILLLIGLVILVFGFSFSGLSRSKIFKFQRLIAELIHSKDYANLFALIDNNLNILCRVEQQNFFLNRIRNRFIYFNKSIDFDELAMMASGNFPKLSRYNKIKKSTRKIISSIFDWIGKFSPSYDQHAEAAHDVLHQIFTSRPVVREIASTRPYFALKLLDTGIYEIEDFLDIYLRFLIGDKYSILYFELKNNQNVSSSNLYEIPKSNRLLYYFFSDAKKSESLGVWGPIGEVIIERLDELSVNQKNDPYNKSMGSFMDSGQWEDPIFVGIFFFDVMVSTALHQGVAWHMWLYHYQYFTERIVNNYRIDGDSIDEMAEWPTKYSYFIYKIISSLAGWLRATISLPSDQENILIKEGANVHENGNIAKSAAFVLINCIKEIVVSPHITINFCNYIAGIVFEIYFRLRNNPKTELLATVIRSRMCGPHYPGDDSRIAFCSKLRICFEQHDKIHYPDDHVQEFERAISSVS